MAGARRQQEFIQTLRENQALPEHGQPDRDEDQDQDQPGRRAA